MSDDYRQRLADAVEEVFHRQYCGDGPCVTSFGPEAALLADAVLAVRDEEMAELRTEVEKLRALLCDAKAALIDLGCCDDPNCTEQACNHVLPRIAAALGGA